MKLKQRLDRLERERLPATEAVALFWTIYEGRGSEKDDYRSALLVWPDGKSLRCTRGTDETNDDFKARMAALGKVPFNEASEQMRGTTNEFGNH